MFQKRTLDAGYFYMNSSRQTCWSPQIPATGTTIQSTNDVYPNRVFYSQPLQPEAVPLLNFLDVGSANFAIQAMIPLRNGCLFFKEDGIYRLYGLTTPFTIIPLDFSARIIAPNSAVVLNNLAFVLTDQGVIQCDENGAVQILSRPIENVLNTFTSPTLYPNFEGLCFAVGYNADRKYVLNLPTQSTDTSCTQQFVWNHITQTWTHWTLNTTCGIISDATDKMYLGSAAPVSGLTGYVLQERKSFNSGDYVDLQGHTTITGVFGNTLNVSSTNYLMAGDVITQPGLQLQSVITEIISGTSLAVADALPWSYGTTGPIVTASRTTFGFGYVDGSYINVPAVTLTGSGYGATFDVVTISYGEVVSIGVISGGNGYAVGDTFTFSAASLGGTGSGFVGVVNTILSGAATVYQPIKSTITSIQQDCKAPGTLKHFKGASFLFSETTFSTVDVTFYSDLSSSQQTNTLTAQGSAGWGDFAWGALPWGGGGSGQSRLYTLVPRNNARANWIIYQITNNEAFTNLAFSGVSLSYTSQTDREGTVQG